MPRPEKRRGLILAGDSAFAEVAFEYFAHDSEYEVVAFAVEQAYRQRDELFGRPVVDLETVQDEFDPADHSFHAALVYTQGNRLRQRIYESMKSKGFTPASYVSSRAFVWRNVELGEHCFIFEDNVIQPFVTIGRNVVLWSGNHIGHHSRIGDHTFISSHVVVSGFCSIGQRCFMGVNASIADRVSVGDDVLVGAAATIVGDVGSGRRVVGLWKRDQEQRLLEQEEAEGGGT